MVRCVQFSNTVAISKILISFENAPGYATEKIVTAFLPESSPIYFGHSDSVPQLFSFFDCGKIATLRNWAEQVILVHHSVETNEAMLEDSVV